MSLFTPKKKKADENTRYYTVCNTIGVLLAGGVSSHAVFIAKTHPAWSIPATMLFMWFCLSTLK